MRSSSSAHAPTSVPVSSVHMYLEAVWVRNSSSAHAPTYVPLGSVHLYLEAMGKEQLLCACSYLYTSDLSSPVPGGCG